MAYGRLDDVHWSVQSYCRTCFPTLEVDLRTIVALRGRDFVLWNHQTPCKRLGAKGSRNITGDTRRLTATPACSRLGGMIRGAPCAP